MTDLVESSTWTPGIRQFETSDPVEGGPDGIDNVPLRQLANRTRFLKDRQEAHEGAVDPYPQYATKDDLAQKLAALVDQSPEALNTLRELANALGNDPNFATTITNELAKKASVDSPVFTGTPKGPTPQQFDSTARLATMAAVQTALGNMRGIAVFTANSNQVLGLQHVGALVVNSSAGAAYTYSLPSAASCPQGSAIWMQNVNSITQSIARSGNDLICVGGQMGGNLVTTVSWYVGDTLCLVSDGVSRWYVAGGTASLPFSGLFASSLAASGYQKLPSGLIIQWGGLTNNGSGARAVTIPLPLTFPNACLRCFANDTGSACYTFGIWPASTSQLTLYAPAGSIGGSTTVASSSAFTASWLAIGY
ncbi:hypothetical protein WM34_30010 [Burkholderia ubonensis]|uniref:gp53-like domain-containing protein n=1 Tax=Burkholderia ubonensis TaxID=101571 RepID=UPI00075C6244|nr:hypothetical protein [Burkholderia ubonensis]KWD09752.1 hypothetical protein WL59_03960 [Burkholderia ubonensis]KWD13348.1 hypothetical protein WL60_17925 [Burkholderia ubonensis]KWQ01142.1 hypothetical protein WM34_30010 [Burkholderia ubonensis]